jgi:nucleotide-binding universal stress UspA family protein
MKNIFVSIDFHDKTTLLIDYALQLANAFNSKIWLIHVAAPDPDFVGYEVGPQYIRDNRAEELKDEHKLLIKYRDLVNKHGIDVEALLIQGSTIESILEESKKLDIDLIVMGQHNHSFLYNLFHESVSNNVIQESKIPIFLIPF